MKGATENDLRLIRVAVAEVAPGAVFRLRAGIIEFAIGSVDPAVARRAGELAGISQRCDACFAANVGRYDSDDPCAAGGPPPYAADCGKTPRDDRSAVTIGDAGAHDSTRDEAGQ